MKDFELTVTLPESVTDIEGIDEDTFPVMMSVGTLQWNPIRC